MANSVEWTIIWILTNFELGLHCLLEHTSQNTMKILINPKHLLESSSNERVGWASKIGICKLDEYLPAMYSYEGKSISNQPSPFPIDRDTQDFHALFQYMF